MNPPSETDIEHCRALTKRFATNYYLATRFFPMEMRRATWILYAFVRVPDEFVDTDHSRDLSVAREQLQRWKESWESAYGSGTSDDPVLRATAWLFHTYSIPFKYSAAFLSAMLMDTEKARYATFGELDAYMEGSAQAVGLMMSHVIGFQPGALEYARALGNAFQLTNFLRDIREDYELRDRIYMPQEELARFGLSDEDIKNHVVDDRWRDFMRFQIERAREYYRQADIGIPMLDQAGQRAVRISRHLYASILTRIEENGYDVYAKRASTPMWKKLSIAIRYY